MWFFDSGDSGLSDRQRKAKKWNGGKPKRSLKNGDYFRLPSSLVPRSPFPPSDFAKSNLYLNLPKHYYDTYIQDQGYPQVQGHHSPSPNAILRRAYSGCQTLACHQRQNRPKGSESRQGQKGKIVSGNLFYPSADCIKYPSHPVFQRIALFLRCTA